MIFHLYLYLNGLQILKLPVKSERDLNGIMNLVFEKAIAEPGFSVTYASLCQNLAQVLLTNKNLPTVGWFRFPR